MEIKKSHKKFEIILYCILGVFVVIVILYICFHWQDLPEEFKTKDKPFYLVNVVIALAAIATAIFTWWKNTISKEQVEVAQKQTEEQIKQTANLIRQTDNAQRQIELQEETRLDSLYAKAIEFIKDENDLLTRKGGVHILKDLAVTSPKHTQKCIDMLCSLNESWMPLIVERNSSFFSEVDWVNTQVSLKEINEKFDLNISEIVLAKILLSQTVLKHLSFIIEKINTDNNFNDVYDITYKYLCSIKLKHINHLKFKTEYVNLSGANLVQADLKKVDFRGAVFRGAILGSANLSEATLVGVKMQGANASHTIFEGAFSSYGDFEGAFLSGANFNGAFLGYAKMIGAHLSYSKFIGSNVEQADFRGADLSFANFEASNLNRTIFLASDLSYSKFGGALMFKTFFENSEFESNRVVQSVFGNSVALELKSDFFGKPQDSFLKFIEERIREKLQGSDSLTIKMYRDRLLNANDRYLRKVKFDFNKLFNVVSIDSEESLALRHKSLSESKFSSKGSLEFSNFYADYEVSQIITELNTKYIEYLINNKQDWFKDFQKENLISDLRDKGLLYK